MNQAVETKPSAAKFEPKPGARPIGRRLQPLPIRLAHWLNVLLLVLMAGSGLQILTAYPSLGPQGAQYRWYPFQGTPPPPWLRIGGWLGGARHWHFANRVVLRPQRAHLPDLFSGEWRVAPPPVSAQAGHLERN